VYFAWADPKAVTLIAMTHDGETVWKRDLGPWLSQHGFGTSPIVYENLVILSNSQEIKDAPEPVCTMLAFDRKTGEDVWSAQRHSSNTSYSVPAIFQPKKGKPQLVNTNTGDGIYALDPLTGKELWSAPVIDKRTVSSPVVNGDIILGSTGSGGGGNYLVAVRSDGKTGKEVYRITTSAPYVPTSVARGNLIFLMSDGGIATCIDVKTGKVQWLERIGGNYSSSLVRVHDKIYCASMDGEIVVFAADKKFKELARMPLEEPIRSTPAIANGRMYLRTFSHLMSIGGPGQSAAGAGN
jgi:outer membrane protein assembly factor BamB